MRLGGWLGLVLVTGTAAVAAGAAPGEKPVLPWIVDDYPKALGQARSKKLPIFVEAWAPW